MMSITPNLRNVKPSSKYMEKRTRLIGRSRLAYEYERSANNQKTIVLSWVPASKDLLEIYVDGIRMLDGWTIKGSTVTFTKPTNGNVKIIEDSQVVDTSAKWLKIDIKNLLYGNDYDYTGYGTDRREGPLVAVHARPIAITQPGLGYVRPSPDNEELWYCSNYGMFGRDSVTYAIITDGGQLSDYRCIDIRVRDPNYIPEIRMCMVSAVSSPVKLNGVEVDITPDGTFQIYAECLKGGSIQLPNKKTVDELSEYHLIVQGKDEEGDWFELTEYFDEGEYTLSFPEDSEDFVITEHGDASAFGFENAYRISFTAKKNRPDPFNVTLSVNDRELFNASVFSAGVTEATAYSLEESEATHIIGDKAEGTEDNSDAQITYVQDRDRFNTTVIWTNPDAELRTIDIKYRAVVGLDLPYFDPVDRTEIELRYDVSTDYTGSFDTNEPNVIVAPPNRTLPLLEKTFVWESADPYSNMAIVGPLVYSYKNTWTIT